VKYPEARADRCDLKNRNDRFVEKGRFRKTSIDEQARANEAKALSIA
jgi:hypothetical protein